MIHDTNKAASVANSRKHITTKSQTDFRHPAYPKTDPPLLRLDAFEGDHQDGLNYHLALWACGIVTGNTWPHGRLATKADVGGFITVNQPEDGVLRRETYYYLIGEHPPTCKFCPTV